MSKKIKIIIICAALCVAAAAVLRFAGGGNDIISRGEAIDIGSAYLRTNYTILEGDAIDAVLEGDAWKVYNIPGDMDVDENGAPLEYYGSAAFVYVRADTGEILTTGISE